MRQSAHARMRSASANCASLPQDAPNVALNNKVCIKNVASLRHFFKDAVSYAFHIS